MDETSQMSLTFRCPPELEGVLPRPIPAVLGLPDWFKAMPATAFNQTMFMEEHTVKKCPPFIDAMSYGFLIPLAVDLTVRNGEFSWTFDPPPSPAYEYPHSPIGFHDPGQTVGTPFFDADRFIIKFNNFWTIEAPPGYSLFFTHPVNRTDLPFRTLTGLVDCDTFRDSSINFPAHWHDTGFNGVLPRGTPVAQCLPVKREQWSGRFVTQSDTDTKRLIETRDAIKREPGVYRRQFRVPKH
jgi:hypothetical protein